MKLRLLCTMAFNQTLTDHNLKQYNVIYKEKRSYLDPNVISEFAIL